MIQLLYKLAGNSVIEKRYDRNISPSISASVNFPSTLSYFRLMKELLPVIKRIMNGKARESFQIAQIKKKRNNSNWGLGSQWPK